MERDDTAPRNSLASAVVLPVLLIDLGLNEIFENIARALYNGAFDIIELLFAETIGNLLKIQPSRLSLMQDMWSLSLAVYFSLLGILGLSYLGMFQLFPASKKTDPYRFMGRAFAATMSLFVINPPGGMSTLFSQGAFAWALRITNILIDYFLLNMTYTPDNYAGATSGLIGATSLGAFGAMSFGLLMLVVVGILVVVLYVVLAARMLVILITFGLYPLLIVFWVADVGPMKYGKQLSGKLFKATGMLIPLGILLAAVLSTAGQMMTGALVNLGGTNPLVSALMVTIPIPVASFMMITMTMAPLKMAGVGVGAAVGKAKGAVSKAGRKGKSMVRGRTSGESGMLGGLAGGGAMGAALANEDEPAPGGGGQVQSPVAQEPESTSAIGEQSTLGPYTDEEMPEPTARPDAGTEYSASDTKSLADAESTAELGEGLQDLLSDDEFSKLQTAINDVEDGGNNYLKAAVNDGVKGAIGGAAAGTLATPAGTAMGALAGFGAGAVKGIAGEAGGSIAVNWREDDTNLREAFSQEITNTKAGAVYATLTGDDDGGAPMSGGGAMSGGSSESGGNNDFKEY